MSELARTLYTREEINELRAKTAEATAIDIEITDEEKKVAMCTHFDENGNDVRNRGQDNECCCIICGAKFNAGIEDAGVNDIRGLTDQMIAAVEIAKHYNYHDDEAITEYFAILIPMLKKFPAFWANAKKVKFELECGMYDKEVEGETYMESQVVGE